MGVAWWECGQVITRSAPSPEKKAKKWKWKEKDARRITQNRAESRKITQNRKESRRIAQNRAELQENKKKPAILNRDGKREEKNDFLGHSGHYIEHPSHLYAQMKGGGHRRDRSDPLTHGLVVRQLIKVNGLRALSLGGFFFIDFFLKKFSFRVKVEKKTHGEAVGEGGDGGEDHQDRKKGETGHDSKEKKRRKMKNEKIRRKMKRKKTNSNSNSNFFSFFLFSCRNWAFQPSN